jgi:hypothetical protein
MLSPRRNRHEGQTISGTMRWRASDSAALLAPGDCQQEAASGLDEHDASRVRRGHSRGLARMEAGERITTGRSPTMGGLPSRCSTRVVGRYPVFGVRPYLGGIARARRGTGWWDPLRVDGRGEDPHVSRRDAGPPRCARGRRSLAGCGRDPRRPRHEHGCPRPGRLAGGRGVPRGGARPVLLGPEDEVSDGDRSARGATAQRAWRCSGPE